MKVLTLSISALLGLTASLCGQVNITDIVDAPLATTEESGGGWTRIGSTEFFSTGSGGLTPTAGSSFFVTSTASGGDLGAWKYFSDMYIDGIYTVTFDIGRRSNVTHDFPTTYTFILIADTNGNGQYDAGEEIQDSAIVSSSTTIPDLGTWESWEYTYNITSTTTTVGGQLVSGYTIGFLVLAEYDSAGQFTFDNLSITSIPEMSHTTLAACFFALLLLVRRYRRR